jgi:hypothetical protein
MPKKDIMPCFSKTSNLNQIRQNPRSLPLQTLPVIIIDHQRIQPRMPTQPLRRPHISPTRIQKVVIALCRIWYGDKCLVTPASVATQSTTRVTERPDKRLPIRSIQSDENRFVYRLPPSPPTTPLPQPEYAEPNRSIAAESSPYPRKLDRSTFTPKFSTEAYLHKPLAQI